jgi:hypothetical protein
MTAATARSMPDGAGIVFGSSDRLPGDVVRRVAEARGWPEPKAATFVNGLLRMLHTIGPA